MFTSASVAAAGDKLLPLDTSNTSHANHMSTAMDDAAVALKTRAFAKELEADKDGSSDKQVVFEGYLRKRYSTSVYMGSWRYCILQGSRLRWYKTDELAHTDSQLRGEVWVRDVEPWTGHGSVHSYPHAFAVRTLSNRVLLCSARSQDEKDNWLAVLRKAVQQRHKRDGNSSQYPQYNPSMSYGSGSIDPHGSENRRIVPEDVLRATMNQSQQQQSVTPLSDASEVAPSTRTTTTSAITYNVNNPASTTSNTSTSSTTSDSECARCAIRFGAVLARRYVCGSCAQSFCSRHCANAVKLVHLGLRSARRCCYACARRQDFLLYLRTLSRFLNTVSANFASMDAVVLQSGPQFDAGGEDLFERTMRKLRFAPMSLVKTIKILYQTRKKPHLFRVACERLPFYVENTIDRVENLWYQILHLFQCCDADRESANIQLFVLRRFIRAICRRSPRIALQTIWHVQASVGDATGSHPHSLLALLGFVYPYSQGNTTLWQEYLLAECPDHQRHEILSMLKVTYAQSEELIAREQGSLINRWLNATSVPEFEASARELAHSGIELCEFQTSILYESLRVDGWAATAPEASPQAQIEALVFDQVSFVQSLAAISERLRYVQPVAHRGRFLARELQQLNDKLQQSALYPLCTASDELFRVLRVPPTEGKVFSTKMRAPTLIFLETVPVNATTLVGSDDRLRPFICSSQPRSSTFFESLPPSFAILGDGASRDSLVSSTESSNDAILGGGNGIVNKARRVSHVSLYDDPTSSSDECGGGGAASDLGIKSTSGALSGILGRHMTFPGSSDLSHGDPVPDGARGFSLVSSNSHKRHGVDNLVYDCKVYGESWEERKERIRVESPFGHLPGWQLFSVIVKTNDDLRQEVFTMQLIKKFQSIFEYEGTGLWLRTYRIVATGASIGLLETINDACSLDHLKKTFGGGNLFAYFQSTYGAPSTPEFEAARDKFIRSMAAYSVVSYLLLVKDRHNGNILLSTEGHIIHIDFGFILGIAPGGRFSIEDAPFKLTVEMVEIMGGLDSPGFAKYRRAMCDGFLALQKYQSEIAALLQTTGQHSPFPCFEAGGKLAKVITDLRERLCVGLSRQQVARRVDQLIRKSYNVWGTRQYDAFQLRSNNIHP